ncbi:MAG: AzlD domain-containing protein [Clostridiales bacterium]|nr:AzlD domain-containing protein [Clostridiales bacterium]
MNHLPLILGMLAVTYLPRVIPLLMINERPLPPFLKRFLVFIPYTALSALIVRGIMQASPEMRLASFIGIGVAALSSWLKGSLVLSVLLSILAVFLIIQF